MKLFYSLSTLLLGAAFTTEVLAAPSPCPLVGPAFPRPTPSSSNKRLKEAQRKLTSLIEPIFKAQNGSTNSVAVQLFDTTNTAPLLQWQFTADNVDPNQGVRTVDQNTVFRVGSVSKIWTVYLFLTQAGIDPFAEPVAKYVPELQVPVSGDAIDSVQWASVTLGELASHLAGISRDCQYPFFCPSCLPNWFIHDVGEIMLTVYFSQMGSLISRVIHLWGN